MQYLYDDGELLQFMDTESYEQVGVSRDDAGEAVKWMVDGMMVEILFHNGKAIDVEVPQTVELKIVETPPNFKGDSQGGKKPATLESGAVVQIPFHVLEGEVIRVDTTRGEYLERVK
jgi:elongation factor P